MGIVNAVLPFAMFLFYAFRYFSKKEKANIIVYFFFATYPFVSSNFSIPFFASINLYLIVFGVIQFLAKGQKKVTINPYMLLLIIAIALSRFNVGYFEEYRSGLTNFLFVLLTYFYLSNSIKINEFKEIINVYKINGFVLSIYAIVEFFTLNDRVMTTYSNPNYFAYYMLTSFLFQFYYGKSKFSLILIAASILFSQSRAATLALVVPFILMRKIKFRYYALIATVFSISYFSGILDRFINIAGADSDHERSAVYSAGLAMIKEHPLIGVGFNNFSYSFHSYATELISRDVIATHNDFLKVLTELGIVGMVILIIYFINSFKSMSKLEEKNKLFAYSICVATCVFCATHNYMGSIEFWMFTSLGVFLKRYDTEVSNERINSSNHSYLSNVYRGWNTKSRLE